MQKLVSENAAVPLDRRAVLGWVIYDWGVSVYVCSIMVIFMPLLFKGFWQGPEVPAPVSSWRWGVMTALISAIVAVAAPFLGAIADRTGRRKALLLVFASLGVLTTLGLFWVRAGCWQAAALLYVLSGIGFAGANVFFDSLLVSVSPPSRRDFVSALAYAVGYLAAGLVLALNVTMTLKPAWFGLADATAAARWSFPLAAAWWALFSLPLWWWVPEDRPATALPLGQALAAGWREVWTTVRDLRHHRGVALFLLAYWLYIDGIGTIIRMAVDYGKNLGFADRDLLVAILITQFVGFPAALAYGKLGERWGAKRALLLGIGLYTGITVWACGMDRVEEFYVLAATVGLVQGGVQALSRSYFSRMIPREKTSEFFGLYNMLGKSAAVLGPFLVGSFGYWTGNVRLGMLSVLVFFCTGGALLACTREAK